MSISLTEVSIEIDRGHDGIDVLNRSLIVRFSLIALADFMHGL